ncbi:IclR family transcriptional regulator [Brachybacterium sacelli]|uniref:DNA-binding IclR family transcriptional regulator n=1 Tax=Brachybacterium sacelli TaxID=173364 RepID=A0ABS4X5L5_9MICO|nr:IclR family transcriptional regulator [Brachybacterium sacelli]MBP2383656.1 DNA-binding IclR family transcriptional regulator [Brachybacterium sacelli]
MVTNGSVQSVDRAARVMEILARDGTAGVGEVARELEVHGSTASRLIGALEAHDLVARDGATGRVRLGMGVLRLAAATRSGLDMTAQAGPVCDALAEELGETVNVAVLRDGAAVNVYQAQGTRTVALHNWVGNRTVLHATSSGKMLMAHLAEAELDAVLETPRERFTDATVTDADALRRLFDESRERGWAEAVEEFEQGLNAVAAPIRGPEGRVVAAVSVAGPAYRLGPEELPVAAEVLIRAAEEISRRLGHRAEIAL